MIVYATPRERAASALAALGVVLLALLGLIFGLRVGQMVRNPGAMVAVLQRIEPEPPKPQPSARPQPARKPAAKGAPALPNLRNQATPVVAPPIVMPLIPPPPIVVATQAGTGQAASTGASDLAGPGQGAGGEGDGMGGGGSGGDGTGLAATGPRQIRGRLSFKDMPDGVIADGQEARVGVRYTVDADGHVRDCHAEEPSGFPSLDALTCRLIRERFVFRPARDRMKRPVRSVIVEAHTWFKRPETEG